LGGCGCGVHINISCFAEHLMAATPTGLTGGDDSMYESEILASPKSPTVGVAL
jgi:hypothetical protein